MRKMKKLTLGRETLRALDLTAVGQAAGASALTFSCVCNTQPFFSMGCPTRSGSNNSCPDCQEN